MDSGCATSPRPNVTHEDHTRSSDEPNGHRPRKYLPSPLTTGGRRVLCERAHFEGTMRITTARPEATRRRILEFARERFAAQGFDAVTPGDIAGAAAIATGMLFNDFATKEAIAAVPIRPRPWPRPTPPSTPGAAAGIRWRRSSSGSWPPSYVLRARTEMTLAGARDRPRPARDPPREHRRGDAPRAHLGNFLFTPRGELGLYRPRPGPRPVLPEGPALGCSRDPRMERCSSSTGSGPEWTWEPSGTRNWRRGSPTVAVGTPVGLAPLTHPAVKCSHDQ